MPGHPEGNTGHQNRGGAFNAAEPGGCRCPFNPVRPSDVCVVVPSAPKVTWRERAEDQVWEASRPRGGRQRAPANLLSRRPPASLVAGAALAAEASRPDQRSTATVRDSCPAPTLPCWPLGPLTGCQLALRTPGGSHSAGSPIPVSWTAGLGPGRGGRAGRAHGRGVGGAGRCLRVRSHASAQLSRVGERWPDAGRVTGCRED